MTAPEKPAPTTATRLISAVFRDIYISYLLHHRFSLPILSSVARSSESDQLHDGMLAAIPAATLLRDQPHHPDAALENEQRRGECKANSPRAQPGPRLPRQDQPPRQYLDLHGKGPKQRDSAQAQETSIHR